MTDTDRDRNWIAALTDTGLLDRDRVLPFEEAVETVASALNVPIVLVGLLDADWQWIRARAIVGDDDTLSLASLQRIRRRESFASHVVETGQPLVVRDTALHGEFAQRLLVGQYGVRAYLGVPLRSASGDCWGTLAAMDLAPRQFRPSEVQLVQLAARLAVSEIERRYLSGGDKHVGGKALPSFSARNEIASDAPLSTTDLKTELLDRLLQELRTPLTSVMGMTSVLNREIYGPLRRKQKEYLKIIHDSGQYLLSLVEEILLLRDFNDTSTVLSLTSVDLEMLCQQVTKTLEPIAARREQQLRSTVNVADRLWRLDKGKVQQIVYHLIAHVIQVSETGCTICLSVDRTSDNSMKLSVWSSHVRAGESLPDSELERFGIPPRTADELPSPDATDPVTRDVLDEMATDASTFDRHSVGLLFAGQLAQLHGGTLVLSGSAPAGYRYVVELGDRS